MNLSNQTKLLLVVAAVLVLIMYFSSSDPIKNAGALSYEVTAPHNRKDFPLPDNKESSVDVESVASNDSVDHEDVVDNKLKAKFNSKNKAKDGVYKAASFVEGVRGNGSADFDQFFDQHNSLVKDGHTDTNEFSPNDESGGNLAGYQPGRKRKVSDEDIFKSDDYLPQEQNKDWFEVMPEPISVKNRHLISVTRPISVNTVGNSHRNMSYDIRGSPPIMKNIVSPWLQSSLEMDTNIKGLC